jgi:hypothetical protein
MTNKRKDSEQPLAVKEWGWKYHHAGFPVSEPFPGERHIPELKIFVGGFEESPFGIEWMRFEEGSTVPEIIKNVPHLAFEVDSIDYELKERKLKIITEPNSPSEGVKVAMVEHNGAPVELIEFRKEVNL